MFAHFDKGSISCFVVSPVIPQTWLFLLLEPAFSLRRNHTKEFYPSLTSNLCVWIFFCAIRLRSCQKLCTCTLSILALCTQKHERSKHFRAASTSGQASSLFLAFSRKEKKNNNKNNKEKHHKTSLTYTVRGRTAKRTECQERPG